MSRLTLIRSFAASLAGLALVGAALAQPQTRTLRVGVVGPFTGASADFGNTMKNGIQLAVDEINAVGGYVGQPLELVVKDDKASPEEGLRQARALVAEGVRVVVGFCNTGVAAQALEVFQAARVPLIIPCATGTPLTSKYPGPQSYIFRTSAKDAIQAPFVVADLARRGWTRVAIFADRTGYGEAGLKDVVSALEAKGLQAVHVARFDLGVTDLVDEMKRARAANADVIFSYTVGVENAVIARARQAIGWKVPQVGAWTLSFRSFIDGAQEAAEGALMAQTFIAEPSNERRAAFLSAYSRKFGATRITVPMAAAQAYDSMYLLMYALFGVRGGDATGPAIKAALENLSRTYYGVVATYEKPFTADDKDAITANVLVLGQVRNGQVTFAYPEDARRNLFVQRKK